MKIAVIGSGIAGLGSAWLLNGAYDVTVYEKNGTVGGHSNTIDAPTGLDGATIPVDTGFIVYNERTYPNLIGLFDTLGVTRIKTDMSFGVSVDQGRLEYGGSDLGSLFAQKRNLISPRFIRMVRDILRFYKVAPGLLSSGAADGLTLADLLARDGYSKAFIDDHLLPMAAAIWSCPVSKMGQFPAASFIRFFDNHGLLQVENRPQWWTVQGGSRKYVNRIRADLGRDVLVNQGVKAVTRGDDQVTLHLEDGGQVDYDRVIFACHGDQAHRLLAELEKRYRVTVITQNVDDLHERGGASNVIHLHGELTKARSSKYPELVYDIGYRDINPGDTCDRGAQLRPHIVWFGEEVPMLDKAAEVVRTADHLLIVGTSLQVYPAAGLVYEVDRDVPITVIDPGEPASVSRARFIRKGAVEGVAEWVAHYL